MNRHLVLAIIIMVTATMYVYTLGPSALLKSLSVEAQETTNTIAGTGSIDISNNLILGNPFYEATSGKVIGQRVLDTSNEGAPQVELSIVQAAAIKGIGNVINLATWTNIYKTAKIVYGIGKEL